MVTIIERVVQVAYSHIYIFHFLSLHRCVYFIFFFLYYFIYTLSLVSFILISFQTPKFWMENKHFEPYHLVFTYSISHDFFISRRLIWWRLFHMHLDRLINVFFSRMPEVKNTINIYLFSFCQTPWLTICHDLLIFLLCGSVH